MINIKPAASRDKKLIATVKLVVDALEIVLPILIFVNLVEYYQRGRWVFAFHSFKESGVFDKACSMFGNIPAEVEIIGKGTGNNLRKSGLTRLPRPSEKDHTFLCGKIPPNAHIKISALHTDYYS